MTTNEEQSSKVKSAQPMEKVNMPKMLRSEKNQQRA
jgi:hypothetical protein